MRPAVHALRQSSSAVAEEAERGQSFLLATVFRQLENSNIRYCVLHGYQDYPQLIDSDVDLLVDRAALNGRLFDALSGRSSSSPDVKVVQWFEDRALFVVLAGAPDGLAGRPLLQLHISRDYEISDRTVFTGDEVLASRRRTSGGFWIPAASIEFSAVLANNILKTRLPSATADHLADLWAQDPVGCRGQTLRTFGRNTASLINTAAELNEWGAVQSGVARIRRELRFRLAVRQPLGFLANWLDRQRRRLLRWLSPHTDLHVVFLGPDGAGKSTVIDAVRERVAPAFLRSGYGTFARGILPSRAKASPHALPLRSKTASLIKAAWWLVYYAPGYYLNVYPTLVRGGLVVNHRYLPDAIVDPSRYRYGGPLWLVEVIWRLSCKPDLLIFLDAPVEVILRRKQEVGAAELARQRQAYLRLAAALPNASVIDNNQPLEESTAEVTAIILARLSERTAKQMMLR